MTTEDQASEPRIFRVGDPGIPNEGIIVGRGGGFTQIFDDIVLLPDGIVRFMNYTAFDSPTIPEDFESVRLLVEEPQQFAEFVTRLDRIRFRDIKLPPPGSTALEYIVLIEPGKDVHAVIWELGAVDAVPRKLISVVRAIRSSVANDFKRSHGR